MPIKKLHLLFLFLIAFQLPCKSQETDVAYTSKTLKIVPVSEHSFVHVSYLKTDDYGNVPCNGVVYLKNNEAVVFDTPANIAASQELLTWLVEDRNCIVKAVVINHFHHDCLGGLVAFHDAEVPSYANNETIASARKDGAVVPQIGFDLQNELEIGGTKIINRHFGEAHTKDNIISYIPDEELIFGGCMIKSLKASKGNLADANLEEWSTTVQRIKEHHPNVKTIIPGHGKQGNVELLDYTIQLFKTD